MPLKPNPRKRPTAATLPFSLGELQPVGNANGDAFNPGPAPNYTPPPVAAATPQAGPQESSSAAMIQQFINQAMGKETSDDVDAINAAGANDLAAIDAIRKPVSKIAQSDKNDEFGLHTFYDNNPDVRPGEFDPHGSQVGDPQSKSGRRRAVRYATENAGNENKLMQQGIVSRALENMYNNQSPFGSQGQGQGQGTPEPTLSPDDKSWEVDEAGRGEPGEFAAYNKANPSTDINKQVESIFGEGGQVAQVAADREAQRTGASSVWDELPAIEWLRKQKAEEAERSKEFADPVQYANDAGQTIASGAGSMIPGGAGGTAGFTPEDVAAARNATPGQNLGAAEQAKVAERTAELTPGDAGVEFNRAAAAANSPDVAQPTGYDEIAEAQSAQAMLDKAHAMPEVNPVDAFAPTPMPSGTAFSDLTPEQALEDYGSPGANQSIAEAELWKDYGVRNPDTPLNVPFTMPNLAGEIEQAPDFGSPVEGAMGHGGTGNAFEPVFTEEMADSGMQPDGSIGQSPLPGQLGRPENLDFDSFGQGMTGMEELYNLRGETDIGKNLPFYLPPKRKPVGPADPTGTGQGVGGAKGSILRGIGATQDAANKWWLGE